MNKRNTLVRSKKIRATTASHCVASLVLLVLSLCVLGASPARAQAPAPEPKTITLEELQQMALQNNPTFGQADANIKSA